MLVLDCDFLRPKQGWQCGRQMVPLVLFLTSPGSSQPMNKQTGPPHRGAWALGVTGLEGRQRNVEDIGESRGQGDFGEWWEGRCVLAEVQSSILTIW